MADSGLPELLDRGYVVFVRAQYPVTHPGQRVDLRWNGDVALHAMAGREDDQVRADPGRDVSGEALSGVEVSIALVKPEEAERRLIRHRAGTYRPARSVDKELPIFAEISELPTQFYRDCLTHPR
jgi:hypothetical protein